MMFCELFLHRREIRRESMAPDQRKRFAHLLGPVCTRVYWANDGRHLEMDDDRVDVSIEFIAPGLGGLGYVL